VPSYGNTTVQPSIPYTPTLSGILVIHFVTDRQTDGQIDDGVMPKACHSTIG